MQDPNLPAGTTQQDLDEHYGEPITIDNDKVIELAYAELDRNANRALYYYRPEPIADQAFDIDNDGQIAVKFEFVVYVNYPPKD